MRSVAFSLPSVILALLCALALGVLPQTVRAHQYNESYVFFDVTETTLSGRIEATLTDLARVAANDASIREPLSRSEVLERQDDLFAYFEPRLTLTHEGERYDIDFDRIDFLETESGVFAQLSFKVLDVGVTPTSIEMGYTPLFDDIDPAHRGYALVGSNTRNGMEANESFIFLAFSPGVGVQTLFLNDQPTSDMIATFLQHGIWHIWLGFDHVLFLVTLLLSAVMMLKSGRWEPAIGLKESLINTVKIVTVFTLAHTVTLSLATFEIVRLPVTLVEAVIAISIAIVAIGNLVPRLHTQSWKIVFVFGLFHGFGFANVLEPLGLDPENRAIGLAAFNIGVEIGQLAIVLAVFPLLFALRRVPAYRFVALQGGSVALIAIAVFWFFQRTYDVFDPLRQVFAGVPG